MGPAALCVFVGFIVGLLWALALRALLAILWLFVFRVGLYSIMSVSSPRHKQKVRRCLRLVSVFLEPSFRCVFGSLLSNKDEMEWD